jgi:Tol biopolymer transport system component
LTSEFASPELLANVNSAAFDHLPRVSSNELTLWFTSERGGGAGAADVWTASRASIDAPFGTPTVMSAMSGSSGDESAALTRDGLVLVFDSTREGDSDIFIATRTSAAEAFPSPTRLSAVNSTVNEYNVFLTLDERELFFSSNRPAGVQHHLFRSLRSCD